MSVVSLRVRERWQLLPKLLVASGNLSRRGALSQRSSSPQWLSAYSTQLYLRLEAEGRCLLASYDSMHSACMHAVLTTVNLRSKSNDIINEGGSVLYSRPGHGSRYLAHKLLLLIHQAHALDNPTLRYFVLTNTSFQLASDPVVGR